MSGRFERWSKALQAQWYSDAPASPALRLAARLYSGLRWINAAPWRFGLRTPAELKVPVIVVGNISVGGTDKTPLVLAIVEHLRRRGMRPGVISRGYGRRSRGLRRVLPDSSASEVGDEPVLIARRSKLPVAVAERRVEAARLLLAKGEANILVADDGLEHHGLPRNMEIVVVDGERGFGNGQLLPAGPLRAPLNRLDQVDLLVANGGSGKGAYPMRLRPYRLQRFRDGVEINLGWLRGRAVRALAGIGHPQRFFNLLEDLGAQLVDSVALPDHATPARLRAALLGSGPVLMTEKDAAKLSPSSEEADIYVLGVEAQLPAEFWSAFDQVLDRISLAP